MRLFFNFSRNNRLSLCGVVDDDTLEPTGWWLSGRVFGRYLSYFIPRCWRTR
jgi:hypothetical protein